VAAGGAAVADADLAEICEVGLPAENPVSALRAGPRTLVRLTSAKAERRGASGRGNMPGPVRPARSRPKSKLVTADIIDLLRAHASYATSVESLWRAALPASATVSYTHLRAHETDSYLVCRLLLEKK